MRCAHSGDANPRLGTPTITSYTPQPPSATARAARYRARVPPPPSSGARVPQAPNVRVSLGVRLPPTSASGADVTADAACSGTPLIVDRYLAHKEVAIHGNLEADPGARIAAFAGLRAVLGSDRLTACPARFHRMAVAELGRLSVASMVSPRSGAPATRGARVPLVICRGRCATCPLPQPSLVPPSRLDGTVWPFFRALNSSRALAWFHCTASPAFV
jgi:hypothetical protein